MGQVFSGLTATLSGSTAILTGGLIEVIADWCDALHGDVPLQEAFERLSLGLGAEASMMVRTHVSEMRPNRVVHWDRRATTSIAPLQKSFADGYFGPALAHARAGTVWLASAQDQDQSGAGGVDPALDAWALRRGLSDYAVLVLAASATRRDHIELHFARPLCPASQAVLAAVLPTMARTWACRQAGLVTRTIINHRSPAIGFRSGGQSDPLLAPSNPANLSRAEFRVCLLLSRGLSVAAVTEELSISDATIRTHLRNIYAKTETGGLAELVFCLISRRDAPAARDRWCA